MAASSESSTVAQLIAHESSRELGVAEHEIRFSAIQSEFPWIKSGELIWARRVDFEAVIFWARPGYAPVMLNRGPKLESLSALLRESVGSLPGGLKPSDLAAASRKLTVEPRGYVASRQFLEKVQPYISAWTRGDPQLRQSFASQCVDPFLQLLDAKNWQLQFRYFNPHGGVELWQAAGDRESVRTLTESRVVPDGTFRFPVR
jgi:hypothetical protein